jgi:apolipoprotein N-acyltransferase
VFENAGRLKLFAIALLSGLLWGLSQPLVISPREAPLDPSGLTGLLALVAFVPVLLAMRGGGAKRGYWLGFTTCVVAFSIIVYWVTVAMTVFGGIPIVVAAPVLLLLTSAMAFYVATAFALTNYLTRHFGWSSWIVFPAALCATELMRNYGPVGGFPWGNIGYSMTTVPVLLQGASLVGVYGLVFAIGLVNSVIAEVVFSWRTGAGIPRRPIVVAGAVCAVWLVWGGYRLGAEPDNAKTIKVALLQGNIDQKIKNNAKLNRRAIVDRFIDLQQKAIDAGVDVVVWPEAAVPTWVRTEMKDLRQTDVFNRKGSRVSTEGLPPGWVIGAVAFEPAPPINGRKQRFKYNTALIARTTPDAVEITGRFDKSHLVPFGEYVPWPLADIIRQMVATGSLTPGGPLEAKPLSTRAGEIKAATTICYEGIFPEISRELANDGAQVMFNVTNDAWYGVSSAAIQHLRMYSMRAAETGRAVARAANTGISAWVDTRGRLHDRTAMYTTTLVIADVPLNDETTPYAAVGDVVPMLSLAWILGAWILALLGWDVLRRERGLPEWAAGIVGSGTFLFLLMFFHVVPGLYRDESWLNRVAFGGVSALIAGVGALSGRPWGRKAQLWVCGVFAVLCLAGGIALGSAWGIGTGVGCVAFGVLAFRRKNEYTREYAGPASVEPAEDE